MRTVKIVRIIMLVAAFTLPLNAQQPSQPKKALAETVEPIGVGAPVHARKEQLQSSIVTRSQTPKRRLLDRRDLQRHPVG